MAIFDNIESWETEDQLEFLSKARRENTVLRGHVHSLQDLNTSKVQEDKTESEGDNKESAPANMEILQIMLENGSYVYCTAEEFSEYPHRTLINFVGTTQEFLIKDINLETKVALASVKDADALAKKAFAEELKELEENNQLSSRTYQGTVRGVDPRRNTIYVRIKGADCRMNPNEWDWSHYYNWEIPDIVQRGETIQVKVTEFDQENDIIRVSRKATLRDPYEKLTSLQKARAISGVVVKVHPIHGIFVQIEKGLDAKGMKLPHLPEPVVGDIVSCTIESVDPKNRRCKVMIRNYPNGKKERTDATAFMFSN
jgi:small subunit ribosomal protein S1